MDNDIKKILEPLKERLPDAEFSARLRQRLGTYMHAYPIPTDSLANAKSFRWQNVFSGAVAAMLIILIGGGGTVFASQRSLPGEPLYAVKLWSDAVRVSLAPTKEAAINARLETAKRRLADIQKALEKSEAEQQPTTSTQTDIAAALSQYLSQLQSTLAEASAVAKKRPTTASQVLRETKQKLNERSDQLEEIRQRKKSEEIQKQVRAALIHTLEFKREVNALEYEASASSTSQNMEIQRSDLPSNQGGLIKENLLRKRNGDAEITNTETSKTPTASSATIFAPSAESENPASKIRQEERMPTPQPESYQNQEAQKERKQQRNR